MPQFRLKDYPELENKGASGKAINAVMKHIWKSLERNINKHLVEGPTGKAKELQLGEQPRKGVAYKVGASTYGWSAGDDNGLDRTGKSLFAGPIAVAELGMGGSVGGALGNLPYGTKARITYKGKTVGVTFRDVGSGGDAVNGRARVLDLHKRAAEVIGFPNGLDTVTLQRFAAGGLAQARAAQGITWAGWHAKGGEFKAKGPTLFGAGEAGPERVRITPEGRGGLGGGENTKLLKELVSIAAGFKKSFEEEGLRARAARARGETAAKTGGSQTSAKAMSSALSQEQQFKESERAKMDAVAPRTTRDRLNKLKKTYEKGKGKKAQQRYKKLKKAVSAATKKARGAKSAGGKRVTKSEKTAINKAKQAMKKSAGYLSNQAKKKMDAIKPYTNMTTSELGGVAARANKQLAKAQAQARKLAKSLKKKGLSAARKKSLNTQLKKAKKSASALKGKAALTQGLYDDAYNAYAAEARNRDVDPELIAELGDESYDEELGGLQSDEDFENVYDTEGPLLAEDYSEVDTPGEGRRPAVPKSGRRPSKPKGKSTRGKSSARSSQMRRASTRAAQGRQRAAAATARTHSRASAGPRKESGSKAIVKAMKSVEKAVKSQKAPKVTVNTQAQGAKIRTSVSRPTRRGR